MTKTKSIQKNLPELEWLLTRAGITVVILGAISSIFYTYANRRFIHDIFPSILYYLNYFVLLGGGFLTGYLVSKGTKNAIRSRLFTGVYYAFLVGAIYWIYEALRVLIQNNLGDFGYPYGMYIFESGPLIAVCLTVIFAFLVRSRFKTSLHAPALWTLIISFTGFHTYTLLQSLYYLTTNPGAYDSPSTPVWYIVASFALQPIIVASVSYMALLGVKVRAQRLLYSVIIGSIVAWIVPILWNFQTDASYSSTLVFDAFLLIIVLLATALLILKAHKIVNKR